MIRLRWLVAAALLVIGGVGDAAAGFLSPARNDSPYRGTVVDDETGLPVSGAVVLAIWEREEEQILRIVNIFYDARETLTAADGSWTIVADDIERRAPAKTWIPLFLVYAPSYQSWGPGSDRATRLSGSEFSSGVTIRLRPASTREARLSAMGRMPPLGVPEKKMPNLFRLLNIEWTRLGLDPVGR